MEDFGNGQEAWFRKFLTLKHRIPDANTFRRVFERLNPAQLMECLGAWLGGGGRAVCIDGKTLRGSTRGFRTTYGRGSLRRITGGSSGGGCGRSATSGFFPGLKSGRT